MISLPLAPPEGDAPTRRYVLRTAISMTIYVLLNAGAIAGLFDQWIGTPAGWLLALAVAIPIAVQIGALLRLIADSDEYLRVLWAKRFIVSAGVVIVLFSAWGFGETYAGAPGLKAWLAYPLFWMVSAVVWPFIRSSR